MATAIALIERSVRQNEIVTEDWTETLATELEAASDDSVRNGPVTEYWGTDDDGDTWRVHLRHAD